jgi:hypothetical protein
MQHTKNTQMQWLELVKQRVESLEYGVVQIVVHDSRVTQIERTEKLRLEPADKKAGTSTRTTGGEERTTNEMQG